LETKKSTDSGRLHFPRPSDSCHAFLIPPSDTLPGVAVRRDRRRVQGDDANPFIGGLRKMVSLRRHGRSGEAPDRPSRFGCPKERAGRACAAHRVADGMVSPDVPKVRPISPLYSGLILGFNPRTKTAKRTSEAPAVAGWSVADKLVRPGSIGSDEHHFGKPPQRDPSRRQKPPNGVLKGAICSTLSRQLPAPRPSVVPADPRRGSRAWLKAVEAEAMMEEQVMRIHSPSCQPLWRGSSRAASAARKTPFTRWTSRGWIPVTSTGMTDLTSAAHPSLYPLPGELEESHVR